MQPLYNGQWKPDKQCGKQGKRNQKIRPTQSQTLNSFCDYIRHKQHRKQTPSVMLNHRKPKKKSPKNKKTKTNNPKNWWSTWPFQISVKHLILSIIISSWIKCPAHSWTLWPYEKHGSSMHTQWEKQRMMLKLIFWPSWVHWSRQGYWNSAMHTKCIVSMTDTESRALEGNGKLFFLGLS